MENLCDDVIINILQYLSVKDIASLHYSYSENYPMFIKRLDYIITYMNIDMHKEYSELYNLEIYDNDVIIDDDFHLWDNLPIDDCMFEEYLLKEYLIEEYLEFACLFI